MISRFVVPSLHPNSCTIFSVFRYRRNWGAAWAGFTRDASRVASHVASPLRRYRVHAGCVCVPFRHIWVGLQGSLCASCTKRLHTGFTAGTSHAGSPSLRRFFDAAVRVTQKGSGQHSMRQMFAWHCVRPEARRMRDTAPVFTPAASPVCIPAAQDSAVKRVIRQVGSHEIRPTLCSETSRLPQCSLGLHSVWLGAACIPHAGRNIPPLLLCKSWRGKHVTHPVWTQVSTSLAQRMTHAPTMNEAWTAHELSSFCDTHESGRGQVHAGCVTRCVTQHANGRCVAEATTHSLTHPVWIWRRAPRHLVSAAGPSSYSERHAEMCRHTLRYCARHQTQRASTWTTHQRDSAQEQPQQTWARHTLRPCTRQLTLRHSYVHTRSIRRWTRRKTLRRQYSWRNDACSVKRPLKLVPQPKISRQPKFAVMVGSHWMRPYMRGCACIASPCTRDASNVSHSCPFPWQRQFPQTRCRVAREMHHVDVHVTKHNVAASA